MTQLLENLHAEVKRALGVDVKESVIAKDELCIVVPADKIVDVLTKLRDDSAIQMNQLMDICGADYPERPARFDVVYHLLSLNKNTRIRVKVRVGVNVAVPSVIGVHKGAGWFERECWDLYGVPFSNNPDMRRILTDYGFEGHPLRKDFPLTGYVEVRYDDEQKRVVYEPVKLTQDFRNFDFLSPWEGMTNVMLPGDDKAVIPPTPAMKPEVKS